MSQKVNIKLERVWSGGRPYLRQPLENNIRLRAPTSKEMKRHKKVYRKQVQTLFVRGKYEEEK